MNLENEFAKDLQRELQKAFDADMKAIVGGMFSNSTATPTPSLTAERLLESIREAKRIIGNIRAPLQIDLYGNPLIKQSYELNWPSNAHAWIGAKTRRVIVVPKDDLDHWYQALRCAGIDVRLEPRYGAAAPAKEVPADGAR